MRTSHFDAQEWLVFDGFSDRLLSELGKEIQERTTNAGDVLVEEGDAWEEVLILMDGLLMVEIGDREVRYQVVGSHENPSANQGTVQVTSIAARISHCRTQIQKSPAKN